MPDYQKSIIYKIVCNVTGKCYIGSTTQGLAKRISSHRCKYKNYLNKATDYISSFDIFENEDYDYCLIEKYPCDEKTEVHARERFYIEGMECVNKVIPGRCHQEYYETHKDAIKQYMNNYRETNKEKLKQNMFKYHNANREKHKQQMSEYRKANKDSINTKACVKHNCECGGKYTNQFVI